MPRLKKISPKQALAAINKGQKLQRVHIIGSFVVPLSAPFTRLSITHSVIEGNLNIWETHIEKDWALTGTRIEGNLDTSEVTLGGNADWMGLEVQGNMDLTDIDIGGTLALHGAKIGGDMLLEKANLRGHVYFSFTRPPLSIHCGNAARAHIFHLLAPTVPMAFESQGLVWKK